jgi:HPt (histidine-containing phosphotransfer) domain-containing protein
MPEMDGLTATRRVRDERSAALNHSIPIIAMTAHALQGDRENCLQAGMNDYVSKPVDPGALAKVLERWLPHQEAAPEVKVQSTRDAAPAQVVNQVEAAPLLVFDKNALLRRLMDDEDLVREVCAGFLVDIPEQIRVLKNCLEAGKVFEAERQAHTIKGASANIGGEALRAIAFELEKLGKSGDLTAVHERMGELELQFECLREALEKEI